MNNIYYDYKINRIKWYEKVLLMFKPMIYITDRDGNIKSAIGYKHLFNKTYILKENISIEKGDSNDRK